MSGSELALFLAHAVALEAEAEERYGELAQIMDSEQHPGVHDCFARMARESRRHREALEARAGAGRLPVLDPWDHDWPEAEPPETLSFEALHYRMTAREALELALAGERAAERWYRAVNADADDPQLAALSLACALEEREHVEALEERLALEPAAGDHERIDDDPPVDPG